MYGLKYRLSTFYQSTRRWVLLLAIVAVWAVAAAIPAARGLCVFVLGLVVFRTDVKAALRHYATPSFTTPRHPAARDDIPYEIWRNRNRSSVGRARYRALL